MKKKTKTKAKVKVSDSDKLYAAINRYLKRNGWNVVVIGPACVKQDPFAFKYDFKFVVNFTGGKRAPQKTPSTSKGESGT